MKSSCDVVRDLLPLYQDGVCSEESSKLVENHLKECEKCREISVNLKNTVYDDQLRQEGERVLAHHAKQQKRKTLIVGACIGGVLMIPVLICFICNLAVGHALDWFFIVLTGLMLTASLIVVPLIASEKKLLWTLGCGTGSLLLLLFVCCLYTHGDWFFVAAIPIFFGLSVCFLPYVLHQLPIKRCKGLLYMSVNTILLFALILTCGLYVGDAFSWRIALSSTVFGLLLPWGLFGIIRFIRWNGWIKAGISTFFVTVFISITDPILSYILHDDHILWIKNVNLMVWRVSDDATLNGNIIFLIFMGGMIMGSILLAVGVVRARKQKRI